MKAYIMVTRGEFAGVYLAKIEDGEAIINGMFFRLGPRDDWSYMAYKLDSGDPADARRIADARRFEFVRTVPA